MASNVRAQVMKLMGKKICKVADSQKLFLSQRKHVYESGELNFLNQLFAYLFLTKSWEKKTLVECFAKHLVLLDSMQRTVRFVDLKNLGIESSCSWLCPYYAGREASSQTIWSMLWASSNFLLKSEIHRQHTWWHSAPLCAHMPMIPRESMFCAKSLPLRAKLCVTTHSKTVQ